MKPLTGNERRLLAAYNTRGIHAATPGYLVENGLMPADSSLPGLHQTAASLVRKECLVRRVLGGITHYQITLKGRRQIPDPAKGEYVSGGQVRVCRACATPPASDRHTCGLKGLQAMLPIGGSR